jgi:hypothetical protein
VAVGEIAGIENLDTCFVVAIERRHCLWTAGFVRICRVGKPDPEVVQLNRNCRGAGVQDEGFMTEDPSQVNMVRSAGAATCLSPNASRAVSISDLGPVQNMHVEVFGLPADTDFTLFVIKTPNAPFTPGWYNNTFATCIGCKVALVNRMLSPAAAAACGTMPTKAIATDTATAKNGFFI